MTLTLNLSPAVEERLQRRAILAGMPLTDLVAEIVEDASQGSGSAESQTRNEGVANWAANGQLSARTDRNDVADGVLPGLSDDPAELQMQIRSALLEEPIEDGVVHPAEVVLTRLIGSHPSGSQILVEMMTQVLPSSPAIAASLLRLLGRFDEPARNGWGYPLCRASLINSNVEVRDAAARALEAWDGPIAIEILREHVNEERVSWLRRYMEELIKEAGA